MKWILLTATLLYTHMGWAQDTIEVLGKANLSIPADYVELNIGLDSHATKPAKAARDNATDMARLVTFLQDRHISDADMRTTQLSLQAIQDYQKNVITGYMASRTLHIKVRDFDNFDRLLVDLAQRGGNRLHGYQAKLDNAKDWQTQLLETASDNARQKAQVLAHANQRQLGPVVYITEAGSHSSPSPVYSTLARSAMSEAAASVPSSLQAGNVQLSKQLLVRYQLND